LEDKIDLITAIKQLKKMQGELENRNMTANEYDNLQAVKYSLNYLESHLENIRKNKTNSDGNKENE
jgi:formyltetrahydrofolate synthetase